MPLRKQWHDLSRSTVGSVPDRYGVYELGDDEGNVLSVEAGVLRDELKGALSRSEAEKVRWDVTQTREQAAELAEDHRDRL